MILPALAKTAMGKTLSVVTYPDELRVGGGGKLQRLDIGRFARGDQSR